MDDLLFRRNIYADPKTTDPDVISAKNLDPAKQKFAREIEQLDQKIFDALNVPVPEELSEKLILRQSLASHQQQKKSTRIKLAIAASVAFAIGLTINQLQFSHAYSSVGDYAIAHTNHEASHFNNNGEATVTLAALNKKMASFNGQFTANLGELMMAEYCRFDGMRSLHLVLKGQKSPVNIYVVPANDHLAYSKEFTNGELSGLVNDFKTSQIIVVGDLQEPLQQWQQRINKNVRWST
ncbi:DUF3379 family protein [Thalassotalea castellviae]|uniref:DUF3379 family protein n=1 Tax=Thalassotalea castellviae TaxID=3075612 RepID=A0ABU2ZXW6_9GAMM|nr:DUF3379 family protein [Thalassotalea sp. W431]MDT0602772.1 DUF3379 family protein [Thalassotalea sp. W431]